MSKKYVYLAGPIEGCNDDEINEWRDYAVSVIKTEDNFLENLAISLVAICSVILISNIILQWI